MTNLLLRISKYYLVDAGFILRAGFLAPYLGVRYHLKEYSKNAPENALEMPLYEIQLRACYGELPF